MNALLAPSRSDYAGYTDDELRAHIFSCSQQMEAAYERFQRFRLPGDRDAAIELMHLRDAAILAQSPAAKQARFTEIDNAIRGWAA